MLLAFTALVSAATPLAPTGKWVVDFAAAQCVASRQYGDEKLFIKASPMGDVVQIGLMRAGSGLGPRAVDVELQPQGGATFKGSAIVWTAGKPSNRLYMVNLPVAEFNRVSRGQALRIRFGDSERHLSISGMRALAGAMKTCVDDLQECG